MTNYQLMYKKAQEIAHNDQHVQPCVYGFKIIDKYPDGAIFGLRHYQDKIVTLDGQIHTLEYF